jgi:hypothetical protein
MRAQRNAMYMCQHNACTAQRNVCSAKQCKLDGRMLLEQCKLDGRMLLEQCKLDGRMLLEQCKLDGRMLFKSNR